MRYVSERTITLSEDDSTAPKRLRFQEKLEAIERDLIAELESGTINVPANLTYQLPMGGVGQGEWFYLYADKEFQIKLDSGLAITLAAGKSHELWAQFTTLEVVTTEVTRINFAIGGQ